MKNKIYQNYENNFINNKEEMNQINYSQYENLYFYQPNQNIKNEIENPKVIKNNLISTNNATYSLNQQNQKLLTNNNNIVIKNKDIKNYISLIKQNENIQIKAQKPIKSYQNENDYQLNHNQLKQDLSISIQKPTQNYKICQNNQFNIQHHPSDDLSFTSQKISQSNDINLNNSNYFDFNINNTAIKNKNKINNIVNIDNQSSAIQLSFISKKPKKKYKISSIAQVGVDQTPIHFSFIAEKPNKYMSNNNLNESNGQNLSFISSRQVEQNDLNNFSKQEMLLNPPKQKNNLKIMSHSKSRNRKDNNQSKPKPVLQIVSKNNNYNKKVQDNFLSQTQMNGFSTDNNKNKDFNEIVKSNNIYISRGFNEIFNNTNQDLSFISNSKETENLLEMNGINLNDYKINISNSGNISPPKDQQIFSINNGLSLSQQSANNKKSNYMMMNSQLCYLSQIQKSKEDKNNNEYEKNEFNCSYPKKRVKIEYYDVQPVSFQIVPHISIEELKKIYEIELRKINKIKVFKICDIERVNQIQIRPYKVYRAVEMEYVVNKKEIEDKKENENEEQKSEEMLEKSFNNNKGNKKRKRRKKK